MLHGAHARCRRSPTRRGYSFSSPNAGAEAAAERATALRITSHVPVDRPELAFVYGSSRAAMATLDRVAVGRHLPADRRPIPTPASRRRCGPSPARWSKAIGTRVFYVTTGGFDTHSGQNVNAVGGAYYNLMATLNDGLTAFYNDLKNQGLLEDTLVLSFSEFGRRISENGSFRDRSRRRLGDDGDGRPGQRRAVRHGARPEPRPENPTLENNAGDVRYETDFRSVYAQVIDGWLGADSTRLLGGNFRKNGIGFI